MILHTEEAALHLSMILSRLIAQNRAHEGVQSTFGAGREPGDCKEFKGCIVQFFCR